MGSYSNVFHSFTGLGYARPDEPLGHDLPLINSLCSVIS